MKRIRLYQKSNCKMQTAALFLLIFMSVGFAFGPAAVSRAELNDSLGGYATQAEIPDTLTADAIREIAGRFSCAKGVGAQDTFFLTTSGGGADTTFIRQSGDTTFVWSNNLEPLKLSGVVVVSDIQAYVDNAGVTPLVTLQQDGAGDAAQTWLLTGGQSIIAGINNSADDNWELAIGDDLEDTTVIKIHTEANSKGIIDFPEQSAARFYLSGAQNLAAAAWTKIQLDRTNYYAHASEVDTTVGYDFTVNETGWYQVNARTEIDYTADQAGYVSIAVYVNGAVYSMGDKQAGGVDIGGVRDFIDNDAVGVSDIVYVTAGQTIDIRTYQSCDAGGCNILANSEVTYFSVVKVK